MQLVNQLGRGLAVAALAVGLCGALSAQTGRNWHVFSNGAEGIIAGVGAGTSGIGTALPLVDGIGSWLPGEDMQGNHYSQLVGSHGYRQVGFFLTACAPVDTTLHFPAIVFVEFDGRDAYRPEVFVEPACLAGGGFASTALAYGLSPGASVSFFLGVDLLGANPPANKILVPNNGILPSSNGGTFGAIAAIELGPFSVGSSGKCWAVDFMWMPTALVSLDHVDGWWLWLANGSTGTQYWGMSVDELNAYTSNTLVTVDGQTDVGAFLANVEYEWHALVRDPTPHMSLAPVGAAGSGPYYASPTYATLSPNGGADIGRHPAYSASGVGGTISGLSGLGTQDPSGAVTPGLVPTLGFHTWDNENFGGVTGHATTIWWQVDFAAFLPVGSGGLTPDTTESFHIGPGTRLPISPYPFPGPFQTWTIEFLTTWSHFPTTAQSAEPDPLGFAGGSFGVPPFWAATVQIPSGPIAVCSLGFPLPFDFGSTAFMPGKGLISDPSKARVGISQNFNWID